MREPQSLWWTSADGGRLHALDWRGENEAVPIIGLPGLNRTGRDFEPLAGWLGGRRRVIGVDLRGRGRSDNDPDAQRYAMPTYVEDVDRLLDHIGAARAILIGGSNGGVVAALYAAQHAGRVAGLVFNDVAHRFQSSAFVKVRDQIRANPRWPDWAAATNAMIDRYRTVHPGYGQREWEALARRALRQEPDGTIMPDFDTRILIPLETPGGPPVFDLMPIYQASAHIPSLLLHGSLSEFLTPETADELAAALPLLERVDVADVGHLPDLAEPECVAAIERLLARVDASQDSFDRRGG